MRAVGIKLLKNHLSEYVRLAAGGETVLVLDREQVVAELGPPEPWRPRRPEDAWLVDAVRKGLVRPPRVHSTDPPPRSPCMKFDEMMADLEASRSDRDLP